MSKNERVNWLTQTLDRNLSAGVEGDLVGVTKVDLAYAIAYVHELEGKIERLAAIVDGMKNLIAMRKQVVETLRAEATEWDSIGAWQSAGFNRDNAHKLEGEIWPLEALLNG